MTHLSKKKKNKEKVKKPAYQGKRDPSDRHEVVA